MEMLIITTTLWITLFILLMPCASDQIQVHSSIEQVQSLQKSLANLPRKLGRIDKETTEGRDAGKEEPPPSTSYKQEASLLGKQHQRDQENHIYARGTRQEWIEETDASQYFTMDYTPVRRRSPIHNKAIPLRQP